MIKLSDWAKAARKHGLEALLSETPAPRGHVALDIVCDRDGWTQRVVVPVTSTGDPDAVMLETKARVAEAMQSPTAWRWSSDP